MKYKNLVERFKSFQDTMLPVNTIAKECGFKDRQEFITILTVNEIEIHKCGIKLYVEKKDLKKIDKILKTFSDTGFSERRGKNLGYATKVFAEILSSEEGMKIACDYFSSPSGESVMTKILEKNMDSILNRYFAGSLGQQTVAKAMDNLTVSLQQISRDPLTEDEVILLQGIQIIFTHGDYEPEKAQQAEEKKEVEEDFDKIKPDKKTLLN